MKKYRELFKISLEFIMENKVRSFLSGLSILVGMTGIIMVLIISSSISNQVSVENQETKIIEISPIKKDSFEEYTGVERLVDNHVINMAKNMFKIIDLSRKEGNVFVTISGEEEPITFNNNISVFEGQDFKNSTGNDLIMFKDEFFGEITEKIGDNIVIDNKIFTIIGFTNEFDFAGSNYYLPEYLKSDFTVKSNSDILTLEVKNDNNTKKIIDETISYINQKVNDESYQYEYFDFNEITGMLINFISIVALSFGLIVLSVSLIGIINMLFVSVSDRKGEIAILRSQGMNKFDIMLLFMFEAFIIISLSTIVAVILASAISSLILLMQDIPMHVSLFEVIIIVIFVIIISFFAAIVPARRASNLNISEILV